MHRIYVELPARTAVVFQNESGFRAAVDSKSLRLLKARNLTPVLCAQICDTTGRIPGMLDAAANLIETSSSPASDRLIRQNEREMIL